LTLERRVTLEPKNEKVTLAVELSVAPHVPQDKVLTPCQDIHKSSASLITPHSLAMLSCNEV
jgi:hypothetical protein